MRVVPLIGLVALSAFTVMARQEPGSHRPDSGLVRLYRTPGPALLLHRTGVLLPVAPEMEEFLRSHPESALRYALIVEPMTKPRVPDRHPDIASTLRRWETKESDEVRLLRFLLSRVRDGAAAYLAFCHLKKYGLSR